MFANDHGVSNSKFPGPPNAGNLNGLFAEFFPQTLDQFLHFAALFG